MSRTFTEGQKYVFDYSTFDKNTVKLFLDYCYGIENCFEDVDVSAALELIRFANEGTDRNLLVLSIRRS